MKKLYTEQKGKAVKTDGRFEHVMAITLDPRTNYQKGVIRCIVSRSGEIGVKGTVDRSKLYTISGKTLENFKIKEKLEIQKEKEVIKKLSKDNLDFLGLEDPDIWIDPDTNLLHLYFTIPFIPKNKDDKGEIHLGHAVGKNLDSLEMTNPVLMGDNNRRAKEVSIAPLNKEFFRYNLIESKDRRADISYSVVQVAIAKNMGEPWEYGEIVFHPAEHDIRWIGGHASPGPLFPKDFIDVGEGKLLGIMNGREANIITDKKTLHGMFSVGLFIYDYEKGKIDWVSPEPFIMDSEAKTITFASQFVETTAGEGILYAHVDDSFVRAYRINSESIRTLLPK